MASRETISVVCFWLIIIALPTLRVAMLPTG